MYHRNSKQIIGRKLFKKIKKDLGLILIINILAYFAWRFLPTVTIRHDGFVYMLNNSHTWFFSMPLFFTGYENSAMMVGFLLPKLFGVNLPLYYWTVLVFMLTIDVLLYVVIKLVTKRSIVAFAASLIFAVHYFGNWDMVTTHCYCFFLERIIPTVLLVPSFLFLHLFLEKMKKKFFILSSLFYFLGVGIGHFTVLFTPLFLFYPIFWCLFKEKKIKRKIVGIAIGLSFLFQSTFFVAIQQINESGLGPQKWTFTEFLFHPEKYLYFKKIALQFVYCSQYPVLLKNYAGDSLQAIIETKTAESLIPHFLIAYAVAALIIYKRLPKQRPMLFTTLLGTTVIFYLNAYFNQYDMLYFSGASRYLYFPTFLLAIFWSYFIWAIFWRKKNIFAIVGIFLLVGYYIINFLLIDAAFIRLSGLNRSTRAVFDHIIKTRDQLSKNTLVIAPYPEFWVQESQFFTERLGKGEVRYISEQNHNDIDTWEKAASSSSQVIKLMYSRDCGCIKEERLK